MTSDPQYRYDTELVFECNEGFQLRGKDVITCKEFGWDSRRLPYCKGNWSFNGENDEHSYRESGFESDVPPAFKQFAVLVSLTKITT